MHNTTWKKGESRAAKLFGSTRRPLSGSNSRSGGRDDSQHPRLFIECKHSKRQAIWTLFRATKELAKKENKTPVLVLRELYAPGSLIVVHETDLETVYREFLLAKQTSLSSPKKSAGPRPIRIAT